MGLAGIALCAACSGTEFAGGPSSSASGVLPNSNPPDAGEGDAGTEPDAASAGAGGAPAMVDDAGAGGSDVSDAGVEPEGGSGGEGEVDAGCQGMSEGCACVEGRCGDGLGCTFDDQCITMPAPVAHWPLNDDAADVSGNAYNGLALNGVIFDTKAAHFDGTDSFIDISAFSEKFAEIAGEMTVYVRVRASTWGTNPILFGSGETGETAETNGFWFMVVDAKASVDTETELGVDNIVSIGDVLPVDEWLDLVFVVNWDAFDLYMNGEYVGYQPFTRIEPAAEAMQIGGWITAESALHGAIEDLQVFAGVLEDAQIEALPSTR